MFDPPQLKKISFIDNIYFTSAQYNDPTTGFLDLLDLNEVENPIYPVNISVYDIEGYSNGSENDTKEKILDIKIEEYSGKNILYISDVWVKEDYRGSGYGTELFEFLRDFPEFEVYVYASTVPMATVARNIGGERVEENWFKLS